MCTKYTFWLLRQTLPRRPTWVSNRTLRLLVLRTSTVGLMTDSFESSVLGNRQSLIVCFSLRRLLTWLPQMAASCICPTHNCKTQSAATFKNLTPLEPHANNEPKIDKQYGFDGNRSWSHQPCSPKKMYAPVAELGSEPDLPNSSLCVSFR